ncbi:unnamed protein product [Blepharisma stoltei]|uniref:Uncharacterized protein n=1 Tax=Blepharisma stoltei TaxID=1481888 RepID=A0AAU9KA64_9CILI|nr:unnamed protein product [Blepharisma stoltei]
MKKYENSIEAISDLPQCIFTNMPSLLRPISEDGKWPLCLELPNIFLFEPIIISSESTENPQEPEDPSLFHQPRESRCKSITACSHTDKKHYAKNMCNNCYHRFGRNKLAWACSHPERQHYAKGKCQLCYLQDYHRSKVFGKRRKIRSLKDTEDNNSN